MFSSHRNDRIFWSLETVEANVASIEKHLHTFIVTEPRDRATFAALLLQHERLVARARIERHMQEIDRVVAKTAWPSLDAVERHVLSAWYAALECFCALYERPRSERACSDACLYQHHSILRLCKGLPFYGCTMHGTVHRCHMKTCRLSITTAEYTRVCMFSGVEIGHELAQVQSLEFDADGGSTSTSRFNMFAAMQDRRDVVDRFENGAENTADLTYAWAEQIERGEELRMAEPLLTPTGAVRSMNQTERRTYQYQMRVQALTTQAHARLVSVAGRVIDDMLFTDESRELLNMQIFRQAKERARLAVTEYVSACRRNNILPNRISASQEFAGPFSTALVLPLVPKDMVRRAKFVTICVRLWQVCHRTPFMAMLRSVKTSAEKHSVRQTTCTFAQFCLAALYMHIDGMCVAGTNQSCFTFMARVHEFIPRERILFIQLPPEDMVNVFGAKSTRRMHDHLMGTHIAESVDAGTGPLSSGASEQEKRQSIDADLFNESGKLRVRQRQHKQRKASMSSGTASVTLRRSLGNARISARESEVLPTHYHAALVGETGAYEKRDIAAGRNFIRACLNSIPAHKIEQECNWLFELH